jgi:hypothetical protein
MPEMAKDVFIAGFIASPGCCRQDAATRNFTARTGTEAVLKHFVKHPGTVMKHRPDKRRRTATNSTESVSKCSRSRQS